MTKVGVEVIMLNNISDDLKKIMLAGIGAFATTAEKSKQVLDELVKKGELTVEQGKVLNEELKRNVIPKIKSEPDNSNNMNASNTNKSNTVSSNTDASSTNVSSIAQQLENMSKEELAAIKAKLSELERTDADGETGE
jgi:polyhydroxyalkanoate synthesis regulator phasin